MNPRCLGLLIAVLALPPPGVRTEGVPDAGGPTREGLIDALEGLGDFDLGSGAPLQLSSENHQACRRVWSTVLRGGRIVPLFWSELRRP